MSVSIKFENNLPQFENELKNKKQAISYAWGLKWLSLASQIITKNKIIDTGRLRASLSFITVNQNGNNGAFETGDNLIGSSGDDGTVIVGSNVKYAAKQEFENRKGPFVRPAITDYKDSYENIAKSILDSE